MNSFCYPTTLRGIMSGTKVLLYEDEQLHPKKKSNLQTILRATPYNQYML